MRWLVFLLLAGPAGADSLVATRTIRAQTVVTFADVAVVQAALPGALLAADEAVGLEARVTIYSGRPVRAQDLGAPAIIERNQIVVLSYSAGGLTIRAEGRALARAGAGDSLRVMNLSSKGVVTGRVAPDGRVLVGPGS